MTLARDLIKKISKLVSALFSSQSAPITVTQKPQKGFLDSTAIAFKLKAIEEKKR